MGWTYNTLNPDAKTSAPVIAAVGITFTTLSFMVVALRMYVRGWMIKAIGIGETSTALEEGKGCFTDEPDVDDWIIVVTWVSFLGQGNQRR